MLFQTRTERRYTVISNVERCRRAWKLLLPADQAAIAADPSLNGERAINHGTDKATLAGLMVPITPRERSRIIYGQL